MAKVLHLNGRSGCKFPSANRVSHLTVICIFFSGDVPTPGQSPSKCPEVIECLEPIDDTIDPLTPRQLILVRIDGIVVPSQVYWSP